MKLIKRCLVATLCVFPLMALAGPVNINTADAETIASELTGVGLEKANAIVEYRDKYGPFKRAEDVTLVKGIGERTFEANRKDIRVEDAEKE